MSEETAIRDLALNLGISLFGVSDFNKVDKSEFLLDEKLSAKFPFAISLGMRLSSAVLVEIRDRPTKLYYHHYKAVNYSLDQAALRIANFIEAKGNRALPIPASQTIDWERQRGHLFHKKIAVAAGLGWLGRNNLLVTPQYGAQVRLATILTDFPFPLTDCQLENRGCGNCYACISACPAGAIRENVEDFDYLKCFPLSKEFQKRYVPQYICGLCVKACSPGMPLL